MRRLWPLMIIHQLAIVIAAGRCSRCSPRRGVEMWRRRSPYFWILFGTHAYMEGNATWCILELLERKILRLHCLGVVEASSCRVRFAGGHNGAAAEEAPKPKPPTSSPSSKVSRPLLYIARPRRRRHFGVRKISSWTARARDSSACSSSSTVAHLARRAGSPVNFPHLRGNSIALGWLESAVQAPGGNPPLA